jgi:hypothetical protein
MGDINIRPITKRLQDLEGTNFMIKVVYPEVPSRCHPKIRSTLSTSPSLPHASRTLEAAILPDNPEIL